VVGVGEDIVEVREGEFPQVRDGHVVFCGLFCFLFLVSD
jgi:hypothetical protein